MASLTNGSRNQTSGFLVSNATLSNEALGGSHCKWLPANHKHASQQTQPQERLISPQGVWKYFFNHQRCCEIADLCLVLFLSLLTIPHTSPSIPSIFKHNLTFFVFVISINLCRSGLFILFLNSSPYQTHNLIFWRFHRQLGRFDTLLQLFQLGMVTFYAIYSVTGFDFHVLF